MVQQPADGVIDLYERHGRTWAADRAAERFYEQQWLEDFCRPIEAGAGILDIGCGSGAPIARYFIERGYNFTGVDSSAALLTLCKEKFPYQTWHLADMRSLALGQTFAGILAWDSFFHLTPQAQRAMFPIFAAHAARSARLMFTSGTHHGEAFGQYAGEVLYHASLAPSEYRELLAAHGFTVTAHKVEDPDCGRRTIWLAQKTAP